MIKNCLNCRHDRMAVWGIDMMKCQRCKYVTTNGGLLLPPDTEHHVIVSYDQNDDYGPLVWETYLRHSGMDRIKKRQKSFARGSMRTRVAKLIYVTEWE